MEKAFTGRLDLLAFSGGNSLRLFRSNEYLAALRYVAEGGQALHVWRPPLRDGKIRWPGAPRVFLRHREWAHLFDQNKERLIETAKKLGVNVIYIHKENTIKQHIDLCGCPLEKAKRMAEILNPKGENPLI